MTGLTADGAELVDQCFGAKSGTPLVRINAYRTDSQTSEHRGFANLLKGVFGTFRNPPALTPRATAGWALTEQDALGLFSVLSLVHRRLDGAQVTPGREVWLGLATAADVPGRASSRGAADTEGPFGGGLRHIAGAIRCGT